ncbi:hypothetical protein V6N11_070585 [Hibiscus sabdariffa]|uniref:Uncharacterized protein n=1 Tax=Hibiscus sabdariffa TaxID=183260 RepID=A0ABR2QFG6_9ROSI
MVGSLGKLYESIEGLSETYMQPNQKDSLLNPRAFTSASSVPLLLPYDVAGKVYMCRHYHHNVADDPRTACPHCKELMSKEVPVVAPDVGRGEVSDGGFVKGVVTYMVMDDLAVKPTSTISSITMLNKFNVKEVGALQEKVVHFGMDEGLKLLKCSLQSKAVLTMPMTENRRKSFPDSANRTLWLVGSHVFVSRLLGIEINQQVMGPEASGSPEIAESSVCRSGKDFVDFLFNIMSLLVGTVIRLLSKQGIEGCTGNIYESIETLGDSNMPATIKDMLLKPMVTNYAANVSLMLPRPQSSTYTNLYSKFNIKDVGDLEVKVASVGAKEAVELLRALIWSKPVLSAY